MRILIADSDSRLSEKMRSFLRDHGHEAKLAENGLECLSLLGEFTPDVLVLAHDLLWGGGDGVMELMREDAAQTSVPVILVAKEELTDFHQGSAAAWLQRSYRLDDLLACIQSIGGSTTTRKPIGADALRAAQGGKGTVLATLTRN